MNTGVGTFFALSLDSKANANGCQTVFQPNVDGGNPIFPWDVADEPPAFQDSTMAIGHGTDHHRLLTRSFVQSDSLGRRCRMRRRIIRFFLNTLMMFALVITTMAIVSFGIPMTGSEGLSKAYAMGRKHHHYSETSGGGSDGKPVHSVPEPSTLILLGSALGAAGLYKAIKRARRNRSD